MEAAVVTEIVKLKDDAKPHIEVNGRDYSVKTLNELKPPLPGAIEVMTLTSFLAAAPTLMAVDPEHKDAYFVHIESPTRVSLRGAHIDNYAQRENLLVADISSHLGSFKFGKKYDQENFIIELQANFKQEEDLLALVKFASFVSCKEEAVNEDDGVTQQVSTRRGVHLTETETVPNPVVLKPFKTFPEVDIPGENFVFRVHKHRHNDAPEFALYRSESKAWELETMTKIKEVLSVSGLTIV